MNRGAKRSQRTRFVFIAILLLLLTAFVATITGGTAVAQSRSSEIVLTKLDPALQAMITDQKTEPIPVIVQKVPGSSQAEQMLDALGGNISQDLPIIDAFATDLDAASILQLAQSEAVAHISLDAEVETSDASNLLTNPGFEAGLMGWNIEGNSAISGEANSEANALEMDDIAYQTISVIPGTMLKFSVWAKRINDPGWTDMGLDFYDANGYRIANPRAQITANKYTQYTVEYQVPAQAYYVVALVWAEGSNGTLLIDDASLTVDGSSLLYNGGFENGLSNWNTNGIVRTTTYKKRSGNYGLELSWGFAFIDQWLAVSPDQSYKLSGWYKMSSSGDFYWGAVWINYYDANYNYLTTARYNLPFTAEYTEFQIAGSAPPQTAYVDVWLGKDGTGKLYLDDVTLNVAASELDSDTANMLDNGDFGNGEKYWGTWGSNSATNVVSDSPIDNSSLKIDGSSYGNGIWQEIFGSSGEEYTLSGWFKSVESGWSFWSSQGKWVVIAIIYTDADGNSIDEVHYEINVTNVWTPFEVSSLAPEGTAHVLAVAWLDSCYNCSLLVDDLSLTAPNPEAQVNDYLQVTGVDQLHNMGIDGSGITIAVLDSGINMGALRKQTKENFFVDTNVQDGDGNGHGTFMAGLIAGGATDAMGNPVAIAPGADIISVQVLDKRGKGNTSSVIAGLQWILDNKDTYNIRVVNMSMSGPVTDAYWNNPINQAVEQLWAEGVVVVVAAGNSGPAAGPHPAMIPLLLR